MPARRAEGLTIRKAEPRDQQAVARLYAVLDRLHSEALPHLFRLPPAGFYSMEYHRGQIADGSAGLLVAEHDGEVVGLVHVSMGETKPYAVIVPKRVAKIDAVAVDEAHQRRGIGRALMERAENWAREQGADELELSVYQFNAAALAFYRALGYDVLSLRMIKQ